MYVARNMSTPPGLDIAATLEERRNARRRGLLLLRKLDDDGHPALGLGLHEPDHEVAGIDISRWYDLPRKSSSN